ncbi:MAG: hypothetical protein CME70_11915 [Halobacteriovorax sp.]|nr:hypothetical protein [Halobacteriovorax sp.]|tara:strand:- start:331631 stop:332479 length:849 start_codon:yes stop_codon:yes gene_type:complete
MAKNKRNVLERDAKKLYLYSGNQCARPECSKEIFSPEGANIGKIAHIVGLNDDSLRHDGRWSEKKLNSYENLLLLCSACHDVIDDRDSGKKFKVPELKEWKSSHEIKFEAGFRKFINSETKVSWNESYSSKLPNDYLSACKTLNLDPYDSDWLKEHLESFVRKLENLSQGVRETLCLVLEKGFDFDLGFPFPMLNRREISYQNFITNIDKNDREECILHIKCLVDEGWLEVNCAYFEGEEATLSFRLNYREDEYDTLLKIFLENLKPEKLLNSIKKLDFGLV